MGNKFTNVDLVRLSQTALPIAKKYDKNKNGTLEESEYKKFMNAWKTDHKSENPLLMQLHIKTLNEKAKKIANLCDTDNYKGVLTEDELKKFMDLCEKNGITSPFKSGTSVKTILTGKPQTEAPSKKKFKDKKDNFINNYFTRCILLRNWLKLDLMAYKGSDKFFHAVGNYEAMMVGAEKVVKEICAGQDDDKRKNTKRPEADYTEDLYANWLGRELYKMYPDKCPNDLFRALAPTGFDIEKSKKSPAKLIYESQKQDDGWIKKKYKQYKKYFQEDYVIERIKKEIKNSF